MSQRERQHYVVGAAHTDSNFMTLLAPDGASGLQARSRDGGWTDVPPHEHSLAVNFGQVLERWCGGRIKATEHRVIVTGQERYSIPFFYEARADAEISPLPMDDPDSFDPFLRRLSTGSHHEVHGISWHGRRAQTDSARTPARRRD